MTTRPPQEVLCKRVHVGCGPHCLKPDWLNVDIRAFPGVDLVTDITQPWEGLHDVDYVFGEHFIEHLTLPQAFAFLRSAWGAMSDHGRIRLSTPALEWVVASHLDPHMADEEGLRAATFAINRAFHGWGHQFLWSKPCLKHTLDACGFHEIAFFPYGQSDDPFLTSIEAHGEVAVFDGLPSVWIVEAVKNPAKDVDRLFMQHVKSVYLDHVAAGH